MAETTTLSTNCTCKGFSASDATQLDRACGKARQMVTAVLGAIDAMSGDVVTALKHHFKLDTSGAHGIGLVYQEEQIAAIRSVYAKIQADFQAGMTYVAGSGGAVASTGRLNPHNIQIDPPFFTLNWIDQATALIHEQAHFASRLPGAFNTISDRGWPFFKAYHELCPDVYRALTTDQALTNADSYAYFAREVAEPGTYVWIGD